ncbi:MAG TPA: hypothetical protein DHW82_04320 [Spirochaetia bacterium]|nr:MAG: hypothetical protein A2Y41_02095 [Spirochaetes bacterium GWB1_36_13]HCL56219.1 hypothetical protein [Spirochaetia bacterium]
MKKAVKIPLWILGIVFFLLILVFLLLSVLFPASFVKEIVLENLQSKLKREVTLKNFDFNIFSGVTIEGLDIKERKEFGDGSFVKIASLKVNYDLLPLLSKKFVLNEATVKGAEVYVIAKMINKKQRFNFDDLAQIPVSGETPAVEEKVVEEKQGGELKAPEFKKPAMPISFALGKVGIEDFKASFKDYTNPVLTAEYVVDKVTAEITDLTSGNNPFGLKGSFQISFSELKPNQEPRKNFNLFVGVDGKIKPFDNQNNLNPEVNLKLSVKDFLSHGGFIQTAVNNGTRLAMKELIVQIDKNLPLLTEEIKKRVQPEIDAQMNKIEDKIKAIKNSQGLSKEALIKEKNEQIAQFEQKIDAAIKQGLDPVLSQADKLPAPLKDKAKNEILSQTDKIKSKIRTALTTELDKIIVKADEEFENQIKNIKNAAKSQIDKLITLALKEAADQLKKWASSLEKSGIGLEFLNGAISFKGGSIDFELAQWKLVQKIDLMSDSIGIQGNAELDVFKNSGKMDSVVFIDPSLDKLGILEPFKKDNKIEIPFNISFNLKTNEFKLNNTLLTPEKIKDFGVKYGLNFVKNKILGGGSGEVSQDTIEKFKNMMAKIKDGKIKDAVEEALKTGGIVENYKKVFEAEEKAKEVAKQAEETAKKAKAEAEETARKAAEAAKNAKNTLKKIKKPF